MTAPMVTPLTDPSSLATQAMTNEVELQANWNRQEALKNAKISLIHQETVNRVSCATEVANAYNSLVKQVRIS